MQSRKHSAIESLVNVSIGYLVAVGSQMVIFPFFGIHIPMHQNFTIGLWFTLISIVRSYILRRVFNRLGGKKDPWVIGKLGRLEARKHRDGRVEIFAPRSIPSHALWVEVHPDHWDGFTPDQQQSQP